MISLDDITARSYDTPLVMEPLAGKDALPVLADGVDCLQSYWLSAGTLLGFYRDKGFIPHDTDIDVGVIGGIDRDSFPKEYQLVRTIDKGDRQMQTVYLHEPTNILFDILHYWLEDDKWVTYGQEGYLERSIELLDNLGTYSLFDKQWSVPENIENYLAVWYTDWRTPTEGDKTIWRKT